MIKKVLKDQNLSIYKLAKLSELPYTTVSEICNNRVNLTRCHADTVYKLSKALKISMENLLSPYYIKRSSFENFKSTSCHKLKEMGDIDFIIELLESGEIRDYYEKGWYAESFYLLATLDYLSRINHIDLCLDYEDIRKQRLSEPLYPASIKAISLVSNSEAALKKARKKAIPEFLRFNIIESEIRDVI